MRIRGTSHERNYGLKLSSELLIAGGYKQLPSHTYARIKHDQEWVSNFGCLRQLWPRFHITRDAKIWHIHLDLKPEDEHYHGTIWHDPQIIHELKRLRKLKDNIKTNKFILNT